MAILRPNSSRVTSPPRPQARPTLPSQLQPIRPQPQPVARPPVSQLQPGPRYDSLFPQLKDAGRTGGMNPGQMVNPGQIGGYDAYGKPLPGGPQSGAIGTMLGLGQNPQGGMMPPQMGGTPGLGRPPFVTQPPVVAPNKPTLTAQPPRFNLPTPVPDLRYAQPPATNLNTTPGQLGNQVPPPAAGMGGTGPLGSAPPAIGGGGMMGGGIVDTSLKQPNPDYQQLYNQFRQQTFGDSGGGIMNLPGGGGGGPSSFFSPYTNDQYAQMGITPDNPMYGAIGLGW